MIKRTFPFLGCALLCLGLMLSGCSSSKKAASKGPAKKSAPKKGIQPFNKVIDKTATSDEGLFTVHVKEKDGEYYYEIPDTLLGREMLMVSRIAKTATNIGYGGEKINTQVLRWERFQDKILLRVVSYQNTAADSLPVFESVRNSNYEPILYSFDIKAYNKDTTGVVIEVTDLFTKDVPALGLQKYRRDQYRVRNLDKDRTYIQKLSSYPINVENRVVLTYNASEPPSNSSTGTISLEVNHSIILLPEKPMMPRLFDERVGYFTVNTTDYGTENQRATSKSFITRWRLEPKDPEAYKRGELVEPVKPIIYYIDPATPKEWVPYLIQGVNDWQVAFEEAGFKNAIMGKEAPTPEEDPEFSPEDARYSVIRYFSSDVQNAYGPHVHDPRSGEILESDIGWYHNVMNLLRNWYFIQTAAINPEARGVNFKTEVMGELIRFVAAHEVGHTLGLPHNMKASDAYPVDSLRSPSFTQKMGTAPAIMDYARFNYVAQPGDGDVYLMPKVGVYDKYAIKWGYSYLPDATSPKEELPILDEWIRENYDNKLYHYSPPSSVDPTATTESLGDDNMKASEYGIANLKRILPNLIEWTYEEFESYDQLEELYGQVLGQWNRYMGHVATNVGGVKRVYKTYDQEGPVYEIVAKEQQKRAMDFLVKQAFMTPEWMINEDILTRIESDGTVERLRGAQVRTLNNVLDPGRMARLIEAETVYGGNVYTLMNLFDDVREGVWTELPRARAIDTYRRNLQRAYLERMEYLMNNEPPRLPQWYISYYGGSQIDVSQSDIRAFIRGQLSDLKADVTRAKGRTSDRATKYHLADIEVRIENILDPK